MSEDLDYSKIKEDRKLQESLKEKAWAHLSGKTKTHIKESHLKSFLAAISNLSMLPPKTQPKRTLFKMRKSTVDPTTPSTATPYFQNSTPFLQNSLKPKNLSNSSNLQIFAKSLPKSEIKAIHKKFNLFSENRKKFLQKSLKRKS